MQLAELLGKHFTTVHKWESGERIPDAVAVAAIERLTKGRVRAASFVRRQPTVVQAAVSCNRFAGTSKSLVLHTRSSRGLARGR